MPPGVLHDSDKKSAADATEPSLLFYCVLSLVILTFLDELQFMVV